MTCIEIPGSSKEDGFALLGPLKILELDLSGLLAF